MAQGRVSSLITQLGSVGPLSEGELEFLHTLVTVRALEGMSWRDPGGGEEITDFGPQAESRANYFERAGQRFFEQQDPMCESCFRLALRHYVHVEGPAGLRTLNCARSLGTCLRLTGQLQLARDLLAEVLSGQEAALDPHDGDTLVTLHYLAIVLLDMDLPEAAEDLLAPAIEASIDQRGEKNPSTLTLQSLLADAYRMRGELASAREMLEGLREDFRKVFGPTHEETLTCTNNLAVVYQASGQLLDCERLQKEIYETRRAVLGPDNVDTISSLANLASTRYQFDEWSEALQMERQVLNDRIRVQGENHPETWTAKNNLAGSLRMVGDVAEARELLEQVIEVRRRELGAEHHETLTAEANLADLLRKSGAVDAAAALAEHVLIVRSEKHHRTHPALQEARALIAAVRLDQGRLQEALQVQSSVLEDRQEALGDTHVDTILARSTLARMLEKAGQIAEARRLHEEALTHAERVMRPEASDLLDLRMNLAEVLRVLHENETAETHALGVAEALAVRRVLYADDYSIALRAFALLTAHNGGERLRSLFASVSALMCSALELRTRDDIKPMLANFTGFHETWQVFCVDHFPEDLPLALMPAQGIESSVQLAATLANDGLAESGEVIDARQALSRIRTQLEQLDAHLGRSYTEHAQPTLTSKADTHLRARREQLILEERVAVRRYDEALDRLSQIRGQSTILRFQPEPCTTLIARLETDQVLILLWHHPRLGYVASAVGHDTRFDLPLPKLQTLRETAARYELRSAASRGFRSQDSDSRGSAAGEFAAAEPSSQSVTIEHLRATCKDALWTPLLARLPERRTLLLVTGPRVHGLPLDCGNPGIAVRYFAGLPSYHHIGGAEAKVSLGALELVVDPAWETPSPIPFVNAEAQIVSALVPGSITVSAHLWMRGRQEMNTRDRAAVTVKRALIACHGAVVGDAEYRYPVLVLDTHRREFLGPAHIQSMDTNFAEFYCSACVGGVISQTAAGDAFGVVSAFQQRGVRAIVASSAPLPDFYMPLVCALYWQARRGGETPRTALAIAKAQLRSGQWPEAVLEAVREAYVAQIEAVLGRVKLPGGRSPADSAAHALARTIGAWLWPVDSLTEATHIIRDEADHAAFSRAYCESPERRRQVAQRVTEELLVRRSALPQEVVEHVCSFLVCYG